HFIHLSFLARWRASSAIDLLEDCGSLCRGILTQSALLLSGPYLDGRADNSSRIRCASCLLRCCNPTNLGDSIRFATVSQSRLAIGAVNVFMAGFPTPTLKTSDNNAV